MTMLREAMITPLALAIAAATATASAPAYAAEANQAPFGKLSDGSEVEAVTLKADNGVSATILTYGATLWKMMAPDRDGKFADIMLGYGDLKSYEQTPNYWGSTIGRYANRIADGTFKLDGKTYHLPLNDHGQSLHGGGKGFDVQNWKLVSIHSGTTATAVFALANPDGASGYPGAVHARVTYSLDETGSLRIEFDATTNKSTVINMTNHGIFNMAGEGSPEGATNEILTIPASHFTPVNAHLIPTGELRDVTGTLFDFRHGRRIADGIRDGNDQQIVYGHGYDQNFALDKGETTTPELAAKLEDPASGRVLEVLTTEPGVQFYSGNFLDGTYLGKNDHLYRMGDGIALEPQKFPDSPNHPNFPSTRVDPGKPYRAVMVYRVSVDH